MISPAACRLRLLAAAALLYNEIESQKGGYAMSSKLNFVDVARTDQIAAGTMKAFTDKGVEILIANVEGKFYAIGNKCSHMGGDLSKGKLEGKIVTCPRHGSQFDLATGKSLRGPGVSFLRLKTGDQPVYEVKVEGQNIKVNLP
jgi:3-phenylpropionate/trans-cinnamate dioxygenase ferredoxin component